MIRWPLDLARREREICGPEDDFDDETNGDPDSLLGEEDEAGFEEMDGYPDEPLDDDGFEDAEEDDGEDTEIEEDDDEC